VAKYYCKTGEFETLVDAPCLEVATTMAMARFIKSGKDAGILIGLSEIGFGAHEDTQYASMIPLLRERGVALPSDYELLEHIGKMIGRKAEDFDEESRRWFLEGQ